MSLVYRFIFVLLETADKMYTAQAARWGYATLKTSYFSLGQLVSNLFHKSYYCSRMLFTTLLARCYTGELKVLEKSYVLSGKNLFLIAAAELALLVVSLWSRGFLGVATR
jgi:cobalt/nickel transport system permease protein